MKLMNGVLVRRGDYCSEEGRLPSVVQKSSHLDTHTARRVQHKKIHTRHGGNLIPWPGLTHFQMRHVTSKKSASRHLPEVERLLRSWCCEL